MTLDAILDSMRYQREGMTSSPLYDVLLRVAIDDAESNGICAEVLRRTPTGVEPVLDALPLRFLGGVHRLVLDGAAPALDTFYASAGGHFEVGVDDEAVGAAFLETVAELRNDVAAALACPVQTNEVGRCASLLPGFLRVARSGGLPLRVLEVGASAGLNLRWDHYRYEGGRDGSAWGEPSARLCFEDVYDDPRPWLDVAAKVVERRGCDRNPIDPSTAEGSQQLRAFVWPDQVQRFQLLDAALSVAAGVPAVVDRADAADWVTAQLASPTPGVSTVVYQSIVWQYLTPETRSSIRDVIRAAGARATADAPVAWLRMEPGADPQKGAEVRLRLWPGPPDEIVALTGYHGRPVRLAASRDAS